MTENIVVFKHNSIRIKDSKGFIYIDPYQMDTEPHDASFILITHDHYDHFSPEDIGKVCCKETVMIVPAKMEGKARKVSGLVKEIRTVRPGDRREINGLEFETVPAYNLEMHIISASE